MDSEYGVLDYFKDEIRMMKAGMPSFISESESGLSFESLAW